MLKRKRSYIQQCRPTTETIDKLDRFKKFFQDPPEAIKLIHRMSDESKKLENPAYFTLDTDEAVFKKSGDNLNDPDEFDYEDCRSEITIPLLAPESVSFDSHHQKVQFCDFRVNDNGSNKGNVLMAAVFLLEKIQLVKEYCLLHTNYIPDLSRIGKEFAMFSIELEERDQRFAGTVARHLYSFYYTLIREYLDVIKTFDAQQIAETNAPWRKSYFFQLTSELYGVNEELVKVFSERKKKDEFDQPHHFQPTCFNNTSLLTSPLYPDAHAPSLHNQQVSPTPSSSYPPLTIENLSKHDQQLEMKEVKIQMKNSSAVSITSSSSNTSSSHNSGHNFDITFDTESLLDGIQSSMSVCSDLSHASHPRTANTSKVVSKLLQSFRNQVSNPVKPADDDTADLISDFAIYGFQKTVRKQNSKVHEPAIISSSVNPTMPMEPVFGISQSVVNIHDPDSAELTSTPAASHYTVSTVSSPQIDNTLDSQVTIATADDHDSPLTLRYDSVLPSDQEHFDSQDSESIKFDTELGNIPVPHHDVLVIGSAEIDLIKSDQANHSMSIKTRSDMPHSLSPCINKCVDPNTGILTEGHDSEPIGRRTRGRNSARLLPLREQMNNRSGPVKKEVIAENDGEKQYPLKLFPVDSRRTRTRVGRKEIDEENQAPPNLKYPELGDKKRRGRKSK